MPRYFRIAQDTGMKEYDDSCEPFEGKCPICHSLHKGNWDKCNDCLEYEAEKKAEEHQAYMEWLSEGMDE